MTDSHVEIYITFKNTGAFSRAYFVVTVWGWQHTITSEIEVTVCVRVQRATICQ